jgi:hypothetical protein
MDSIPKIDHPPGKLPSLLRTHSRYLRPLHAGTPEREREGNTRGG